MATNVKTSSIDLVGRVFLVVSSSDSNTGRVRHSRELCYVSKSVPGIYLPENACISLGYVPPSFPQVGQCNIITMESTMQATTQCTNIGVVGPNDLPCKCPKRSPPPTDKLTLPCSPTEANLPILKGVYSQQDQELWV